MLTKRFSADIEVVDGERAVVARISTASLDRDKEVLLPSGMDAKDFEKNPTVFFQHDYYRLPVGKCVALKRDGDAIVAKTVFAERPATHPSNLEWLPDTLLSLYQQKVMNAFSVGFEPREVRQPTKRDMEAFGEDCQRVYSKWSMYEYSAVTLPANQDAVAMAVSKSFKQYAESLGVTPEQAPEPEPQPAKEQESAPEPQQKAAEPQPEPAPVLAPRKVLYVVEAEASTITSADAVKGEVAAQVAKRCGRIYVI